MFDLGFESGYLNYHAVLLRSLFQCLVIAALAFLSQVQRNEECCLMPALLFVLEDVIKMAQAFTSKQQTTKTSQDRSAYYF